MEIGASGAFCRRRAAIQAPSSQRYFDRFQTFDAVSGRISAANP